MIRGAVAGIAGLLACVAGVPQTSAGVDGVHRVAVSIAGFQFQPHELSIAIGDTVEWTNSDALLHTTASDSSAWSSPELRTAEHFAWVATRPGRFPYHCAAHPVMRGTIVVRQ